MRYSRRQVAWARRQGERNPLGLGLPDRSAFHAWMRGMDQQGPPQATGSNKPCKLLLRHFQVPWATARALLVSVRSPWWKADVLAAHAPCDHDLQIHSWCDEVEPALRKRDNKYPLAMLGDFNARVGTIVDTHIGSLAAQKESNNGSRLHALLQGEALLLPSTFPSTPWTVLLLLAFGALATVAHDGDGVAPYPPEFPVPGDGLAGDILGREPRRCRPRRESVTGGARYAWGGGAALSLLPAA